MGGPVVGWSAAGWLPEFVWRYYDDVRDICGTERTERIWAVDQSLGSKFTYGFVAHMHVIGYKNCPLKIHYINRIDSVPSEMLKGPSRAWKKSRWAPHPLARVRLL